MAIPPLIRDRIEAFGRNLESYLAPEYKETQFRREFIDPFFEALGWDLQNRAGYAEAYKDVIHEDTLSSGGLPDYSFRVGGNRKFFVEAKKPSVRLKDDPEPALQLRRYLWCAGLPLGIVTDFQEFAFYGSCGRPRAGDKASVGRLFYCTFEEYAEKWDEIAAVFSRESVLRGAFDRFSAARRGKRGTTEFDVDFLKDMEKWRELLARNLALRNSALTNRELNFAVQRILDRIVFLRIAEDRGIEQYGQLQALTAGPHLYPRLCQIFEHADYRYNSGLFHFATEKDRDEAPDRLTLGLKIDDATLQEILSALYWPESPYAFAVVEADILGHIYEQFLGKVIHLTDGHRARVEEKPEVRKAGGVYYTPTYIVNYIVRQTVGPLVEGRTPKQVEKLRILDPACGSGSFLLGAFEFLLDWHLGYYCTHDPGSWAKKKNPPIYETSPNAGLDSFGQLRNPQSAPPARNWRLTTAERKRILTVNLYGVDIDSQAVEVTKLSLLLKVLQGEARETGGKQMDFHRVLPDLGRNIKCGNSLIGSDFYRQMALPDLDDEARLKINAFDWDIEFKTIMDAGGFDSVIGNPPYVRSQMLDGPTKDYLTSHYPAAAYQPDTFAFFLQRGVGLLRNQGRFSFIIPNGILTNTYYALLRQFLLESTHAEIVVDLKGGVFPGASVDTSILVLRKPKTLRELATANIAIGECAAALEKKVTTPANLVAQQSILELPNKEFNSGANPETMALCRRIESRCATLSQFAVVKAGMKVRKEFVTHSKADKRHKPFVLGGSVKPFALNWANYWVCYDKTLESEYSNQAFREPWVFDASPKILVRQVMGDRRIYATLDREQFYADQSVYVLLPKAGLIAPQVLVGLICSRLMAFFFGTTMSDRKETFPKIKGVQIAALPIV